MQGTDTSKLREGLILSQLVIQAHPDEAKAYALQADMYSQANMLDSALYDYNKAVALDSTRYSVWYQLMWIYSKKEDPANLLKVSNVVAQRFPQEFMGHYFQGVANFLLQNYPATIEALNEALMNENIEKSMRADVYSLLGDAYHATGQHTESDSSYDRSLSLQPDDATVLNNYSYYLSLRGEQLAKAETMSRRSLELEPGSTNFMDTYAWVLFRMGRYELAKQWMEKALQSSPQAQQNPNMLEHYGDILFNLHEVDKALEYWRLAKEKGANSEGLSRKIAEKRYILATERE
jgi:Tfp pilus assembly protein PilF